MYIFREGFVDYFLKYYIKLWCRMGLYIIGIMFGYFFYKMKGKLRIYKVYKNIFFFYILKVGEKCYSKLKLCSG